MHSSVPELRELWCRSVSVVSLSLKLFSFFQVKMFHSVVIVGTPEFVICFFLYYSIVYGSTPHGSDQKNWGRLWADFFQNLL